MATFPDYTPKPQPNFSTKPVEAPVMCAGNHVPAADTRDSTEEAVHVVSQHGGHSTTSPNKLAVRHHHTHHSVFEAEAPIEHKPEDDAPLKKRSKRRKVD